jgi:thioredoxin-like negative regulator of GroEL
MMKRVSNMGIAALVYVASVAAAVGVFGGNVSSYSGPYKGALRKAGEVGKPVMIDFYTDWCGWCKFMDKQIWEIPGTMEKFVYYRVNAERDTALAKQFKVTGYPTIVFVKPDGSEFHRWAGAYRTTAQLKEVLENVAKKADDLKPHSPQPKTESAPASTAATAQNSVAETAAAAELRTAQMDYSLGRDADAVKGFRQIIEKYPGTRAATQAQEKLNQVGNAVRNP